MYPANAEVKPPPILADLCPICARQPCRLSPPKLLFPFIMKTNSSTLRGGFFISISIHLSPSLTLFSIPRIRCVCLYQCSAFCCFLPQPIITPAYHNRLYRKHYHPIVLVCIVTGHLSFFFISHLSFWAYQPSLVHPFQIAQPSEPHHILIRSFRSSSYPIPDPVTISIVLLSRPSALSSFPFSTYHSSPRN